jgi:hypothetical protein
MSTYWKITLFSNQRDPIRKWKAPTRLDALTMLESVVVPEMIERERAGQFFVGEEVRIRVEQMQG